MRLHFREILDATGRGPAISSARVNAIRHVPVSFGSSFSPRNATAYEPTTAVGGNGWTSVERKFAAPRRTARDSVREIEIDRTSLRSSSLHTVRSARFLPFLDSPFRGGENCGTIGELVARCVPCDASRGRDRYPSHLLIVAMDTGASSTRNIPAKFRYARGATTYAKSVHVCPIITIRVYNEGTSGTSDHSRSAVSLPFGTRRNCRARATKTREDTASIDASSRQTTIERRALSRKGKKKKETPE